HLYGARSVLATGQQQSFLLDWAVDHRILTRDQSNTRLYRLNPNVEAVYPRSESPWDEDVKDAVEDLAVFTRVIHETGGLKDNALVTITSLATNCETHKALEAELDLWLHHPRYSVYDGIHQLAELAKIAESGSIPQQKLQQANEGLAHVANFTAQVQT